MRLLWLGLASAALLLVACGGGGDKTLRLANGDVTESEFRAEWHAQLTRERPGAESFCGPIAGLNASQAADAIFESADTMPRQAPDRGDQLRAAEIAQDECRRMGF
jgi:hypothetical protein